ncbi:DNA internalization-related competence protein ComEC/Rec2 [Facklamia sp. DSM 111019]|nr:DNA internalization-related competence protein ComEC/Rec2 [Facklamia lactis]
MVKIDKFFSQLEYHWFFILSMVVAWLLLIENKTEIFALIFGVILLRIWYLKRPLVLLLTLACLFGISFRVYKINSNRAAEKLLHLDEQADTVQLMIQPDQVTQTETYLSGKAWLKLKGEEKFERPIIFTYWFQSNDRWQSYPFTERITVIEGEGSFSYPDSARNFGDFDYRTYLQDQAIIWQLEMAKIEKVSDIQPEGLSSWPIIRMKLTRFLRRLAHYDLVALHNKLLFNLESETYKKYKLKFAMLGILHYFSISGFHLNYLRRHFNEGLLRIGVDPTGAFYITVVFLFFYACLISWPIGVVRSLGVYYSRSFLAYFNLSFSHMDVMAIVCLMTLFFNPFLLHNLGFVFSFLMSFLLVIQKDNGKESKENSFDNLFMCLLFSWPLLLNTRFEWNVMQLLVLVLLGWVFEKWIMPGMLVLTILLILGQWFSICDEVIFCLSNLFSYCWESVSLSWLMDMTNFVHGIASPWEILLLLGGAIYWVYERPTKPRKAYLAVAVTYILVFFIFPLCDLSTRLTVIDVGQGDALLFQTSFKQGAWLVDTGGKRSWQGDQQIQEGFADKNLLPALKAQGISSLRGVIITHPDIDHVGNIIQLAEKIPIDSIFVSQYTEGDPFWQTIQGKLPSSTKICVIRPGEMTHLAGGAISIFSLKEERALSANDTSLLCLIRIQHHTLLNMGDLSTEQELVLIKEYPDLRADMLKVGHHGSRTSTSENLLRHLQVKLAFISAGVDNSYGHPHSEVIDRLENQQVKFYSTHSEGAIQLKYHPWWGWSLKTALAVDK